jgi:nucleoside 2-deoxyribosyltransferase
MSIKKIYIACALTHVPRTHFKIYADSVHSIGEALCSENNIEVTYALKNSDPYLSTLPFSERSRACYERDKKLVKDADLIIAECTFPSIGLGIELELAVAYSKPIIIIHDNSPENIAAPVSYINPDDGKSYTLQIGDGHVSLMALGLPNVKDVISYSITNVNIIDLINRIRLTTAST